MKHKEGLSSTDSNILEKIGFRLFVGNDGHLKTGVVFLVLLIPVILIGSFSYYKVYREATDSEINHARAITNLMAVSTEGRLEYLVGLAESLASRKRFTELVTAGDWNQAIEIMETVPVEFPLVERIFLTDLEGTETADTPTRPGAVGSNFSHRDWYKGVTSEWRTYVSEVYQRAAAPQIKVIAVATPIFEQPGIPRGIMVLQVRLDSFFDLLHDVRSNPNQSPIIMDQYGKIVVSFENNPQGEIVAITEYPEVQRALQKERGYLLRYDEYRRSDILTTYQPLDSHGWSVFIVEDTSSAFGRRDVDLKITVYIFSFFFIVNLIVAYSIIRMLKRTIEMQRNEEVFLNSIGDGVVAINRKWNITLWNKSAEQLTGYTARETIGKPLRDFISFKKEKDRKEDMLFIEDAMVKGQTRTTEGQKYFIIRKDGTEIPIGDSAAPLLDAEGHTAGAIIVFRDATAERDAMQMKSDFTYASHQFRTPLSEVLWAIESALEAHDLPGAKNALQNARVSLESIRKLSNSLLEISQVDQNQVVVSREEIDAQEEVKKIIEEITPQAEPYNISISFSSSLEETRVKTDAKLFKKIVSELIHNAIHYGRPKGSIAVSLSRRNSDCLISVKDNGIGIPDDEQPLIFTKFFRGSNISKKHPGSGLGLFIIKHYITLLGGNIWFESKVDEGTTFFFTLPQK